MNLRDFIIASSVLVSISGMSGFPAASKAADIVVNQVPAAKSAAKSNQGLAAPAPKHILTVPEGKHEPPLLPAQARGPVFDPAAQLRKLGELEAEAPALSIEQLSDPDQYFGLPYIEGIDSGSEPPDTVLDVGLNHVVQMTNGTTWRVWDKAGNDLTGNLNFGNLWPAGDPCNSDLGDPIVVYDHLADRWLLSQFAQNAAETQFWMCIAISQAPSPLPASGYWLYTIEVPVFPDYPKFGVWPDAYYMSTFEGGNLGIFAFERATMLQGQATNVVRTTISTLLGSRRNTRILPVDLDGPPPPSGTPGFFFRSVDDAQDFLNPTDRLEIYEFDVDWLNPAASTFSLVDTLTPAAFETFDCNRAGGGIRDCISQPTTNQTIDALSNRPMMQAKFRNFIGDFRLVVNQTVDVSGNLPSTLDITPAGELAGVRWYELQKTGANWTIRQQGTYAPQPNGATTEAELLHRWMGSAAMDRFGNIAIGYSVVNDDDSNPVFPGIRFTGRTVSDVPNSMPQDEKTVFDGTTWHAGTRWGDYSAMTVDPADDCTFWYTTHLSDQEPSARTKIASFRFDTCGTDLGISKTASPSQVYAGETLTYTIGVYNLGPLDATNVTVVDLLPAGTTYVADTDSCVEGPAGTLTCSLGDIASDSSMAFTVTVKVGSNVTEPITNTASVTADQSDLDMSNNTDSVTTIVRQSANLEVSKDCKPDLPLYAGQSGTCYIYIRNWGPSDAQGIVLTDVHMSQPGSFDLSNVSGPPGCVFPANPVTSSGTITCNLGTLAAGAETTVEVGVSTNEGLDINDTATVTASTPDPNVANNSASDGLTFIASADLSITKIDTPDPVVAGENLTYTLTVSNAGPSRAQAVAVTDALPAGVSLLSVTPSVGNCGVGTTNCDLGNLASGASATITIVVRVLPETRGLLHNSAQVSSATYDWNNGNNRATAVTTVDAEADLAVTKFRSSPVPVVAGAQIDYRVRVTNGGPSTATDVTLLDVLPSWVTFVSSSPSCVENPTDTLTCDLGTLQPGEHKIVYITGKVDPATPEGTEITNMARAMGAETDPDYSNNYDEATDTVYTRADLWIDKVGNFPTGNPSGTIVYSLYVYNKPACEQNSGPGNVDPPDCWLGSGGPSDAQNVVVTDTLPLDPKMFVVQYISPNCSYDRVNHTVTCTVADTQGNPIPLPAGSVAGPFQIQAVVKGSKGTFPNTATVTSTTTDPFLVNNADVVLTTVQGGTGRRGGGR